MLFKTINTKYNNNKGEIKRTATTTANERKYSEIHKQTIVRSTPTSTTHYFPANNKRQIYTPTKMMLIISKPRFRFFLYPHKNTQHKQIDIPFIRIHAVIIKSHINIQIYILLLLLPYNKRIFYVTVVYIYDFFSLKYSQFTQPRSQTDMHVCLTYYSICTESFSLGNSMNSWCVISSIYGH